MRYLLSIIFCFCSCVSFCQTPVSVGVSLSLPEVALLGISPTNSDINLGFSSQGQSGQAIQNNQTDNTKWLNFTSAVRSGQSRKISAQIYSGVFTSGYVIVLEAIKFAGVGTLGNAQPPIELSSVSQSIITGIGGAYTNIGSLFGYNLKYSLRIKDYNLLRAENNTPYTITFTLTDN